MMRPTLLPLVWLSFCIVAQSAENSAPVITTGTLVQEMADLERLARWPSPSYRTIQFSSYDRRSKTSEEPGWFANADGFGQEPIPGFLKTLREPGDGKPGLYLLAEVKGPGAIVRGWSAGMEGILRVNLDPREGEPSSGLVWEGKGYDFLARRSSQYLKAAGVELDPAHTLTQEDADYLPIPFAHGMRVTWEGTLNELHFYHLQVRLYPEGTAVKTFEPLHDIKQFANVLRGSVAQLASPSVANELNPVEFLATVQPGAFWSWSPQTNGMGSIRELKVRLQASNLPEALRGCLLRIFFDGSQRPQIEAPLGDFFASGPGVNPFSSLPVTVGPDATMLCRFVMPFKRSARMEVGNFTKQQVQLTGSVRLGPWQWDERSLYFRAKWRADHDLLGRPAAMDLPYLLCQGQGVFLGCAAMIMNPTGVPTAGGNWWGEGDEKFLVDGEQTPSTFGTGSEDYFNYSWSRPDLFSHAYCGQPLDSGPDTSGYVSNHRFQIMDAIPFEKSLAAYMELWTHGVVPGMSYARIAYHYARPGTVDDHRALSPSDLRVVPLPLRKPQAAGGASGATFYLAESLEYKASEGQVKVQPLALATQLKVLQWNAPKGATLKIKLKVEKDGKAELHPVIVHEPGGASIRFSWDDKPLNASEAGSSVALRTEHSTRVLNVNLPGFQVTKGEHELTLECLEPGTVGLDYIWMRLR